jgi:hypothetical protein
LKEPDDLYRKLFDALIEYNSIDKLRKHLHITVTDLLKKQKPISLGFQDFRAPALLSNFHPFDKKP